MLRKVLWQYLLQILPEERPAASAPAPGGQVFPQSARRHAQPTEEASMARTGEDNT